MDKNTGSRTVGTLVRRPRGVIASTLRTEAVGGLVLLLAAAAAVVWANLPQRASYEALRSVVPLDHVIRLGDLSFALDLTLARWAGDGLLAVFFFVIGLELKRELLAGALRDPSRALIPVVAAVAGLLTPAAVYALIAARAGTPALTGWAVPAATDIAFALAVLAVLGSGLPPALRAFLLTLAVVDDLLAIGIIALFFTTGLQPLYLLGGAVPLVLFAALVRHQRTHWYLLLPLAASHWLFVHEAGVHATVAGVLLGLTVPVQRPGQPGPCLASSLEHAWRPVSAGLAAPTYAFLAAGVTLAEGGITRTLADPVAQGVIAGLVLGKTLGITGATYATIRLTGARLDPSLQPSHILGASLLGGIGFTISLLIAELSFTGPTDNAVAGVIIGSLTAATLAALVLTTSQRHHARRSTTDASTVE